MPSEERIIADSSPLIGLARIGQLPLVRQLARRVVVPVTVWAEITQARADAPGAREVAGQTWIEIESADPLRVAPLLLNVDRGEAEALALAQAQPGAILLLDDLRARKLAERLGLRRLGTAALLGRAKQAGLIAEVKPHLAALAANGIYLRSSLIEAVLREVGEA